ncbi:MAG TPA: Smr/MutS family protein [Sphingomicrobium sp.]
MRSLSPDEAALWARVTATIRPLSRDLKDLPQAADETEKKQSVNPDVRPAPPPRKSIVAPVRPRPGSTLDGSWDRRLKSGAVEPDRVIDLHGHNLDQAWSAIDRGLDQSIQRGDRVVLLITGHARSGEPPIERGRIRAAVHDWLAVSRHASKIAAVRGAHRRHGGGGSLYLILRRN